MTRITELEAETRHLRAALHAEHAHKNSRVTQLEEALNQIASWREGDVVTGSFDEPGSARIAREALHTGKCRCGHPSQAHFGLHGSCLGEFRKRDPEYPVVECGCKAFTQIGSAPEPASAERARVAAQLAAMRETRAAIERCIAQTEPLGSWTHLVATLRAWLVGSGTPDAQGREDERTT